MTSAWCEKLSDHVVCQIYHHISGLSPVIRNKIMERVSSLCILHQND